MRPLLISALALLLGSGCASEGAANADDGPSANGGSGGSSSQQVRALSFVDAPITVAPRQELTLSVRATPAGEHRVRFALPSSDESAPLDAVLSLSEATTDDAGNASVVLLAPSTRTTFRVRASIGDVDADLTLDVVDGGVAVVEVQPLYNGKRDRTTWVASATPDATCPEGPALPPPDGPYLGFAPKDRAPEIVDVPANRPVAITLRSGHYMGGCTSVELLPATPEKQRYVVSVTVLDRPIELLASELTLSLSQKEDDGAFAGLNQAAGAAALVALLGSSTDDADALLDTMRAELSGQARQDMDSARKAEAWDDLVRQHWGAGAATRVRDRVGAWLATGASALAASEPLLEAELSPVDVSNAELTIRRLAGLLPAQVGLVGSALVSWSAAPDDTVVLSTDLYLSSSRLATGLAEAAALQDYPEAESAAAALGESLECESLGSVLAAAGDPAYGYADCDAECLSQLCLSAVATIWQRGRDVTSAEPARLSLSGAGLAHVGDAAEIAGISGNWVGELSAPNLAKSTGGRLIAAQPR